MVNLLLVKDDLVDLEIFERGVNSETIILKDPSMNDVLELIDENVVHIGFVYHYEGFNYMPFLNEIEMLIDESGNPLIDNDNEFCYFNKKFLRFLEEVKSRNENIIFDLLTCNVIHSYFIDELDKLKDKYGFTFRYSTNDKGYGGDWIQESHDISIKDIYFTEEIDKWEHVLNLSMTPSEVATTYPSDFDWDGTTLSLKRDFEWGITTMNTNFITLGDNEIFDGKGFTISLTVTLHYGLFGSSGTSVGTRPIIKNLYGTFNNSNNSYYYNGFILRSGQSFVHIDNCHTSSTNDRYFSYFYGGGIAGGNTGINGNALIENCSSVDMVSAYHYGGDIAGSLNSSSGGEITIKNCFSRNILYYRSAGILAPFSARNSNWRVYIYNCNCIPKSIHSWDMQSLILGYDSGNLIGNIDISNCYSIFNLTVSLQSGISGYLNYGVNIMNCYFIGNLTGSNTSGIAGHSSNKVTVENSYMVGNITGSNSGGIFGPSTTDSSAINCVSTSPIFGANATRSSIINCSTDLNDISNNKIFTGWDSNIWKAIPNNYPKLATNYRIIPLEDLTGLNLSGFKISVGSDISNVNFTSTTLTNTDFTLSNFTNVDLSSRSLSGTNFTMCKFRNTNLTGTTFSSLNLTYTDFSGSDLSNKSLSNSTLIGIILNNVNLTNTVINNLNLIDAKIKNQDLSNRTLSGITFINTLFDNVNLSNTIFSSSNLTKSKYVDSNLTNVNLSNQNLTSSTFNNSVLSNTNLTNANLNNTSFININLSNRNFANFSIPNSYFENVNLTNTILDHLDLSNSTLFNIDLSNRDLSGLNLTNIKLANVDFTNSRFINVNFSNSTINNYPYTEFIEIDLSGKLINPNLSNCKFINVNMANNDLSNCNLSNIVLTNVNLSYCNLTNCNLSNGDLSNNVILTNSITGPLSNSTNLTIPSNYEIINNYISGFDINDIAKNSILSTLIQISNNTIVDFSSNLFDLKLLGNNLEQKYNEIARLYNNVKVSSTKINVRNLNKDGFWINASNSNASIDDISNNEYLYFLNVPNYDVSVNIGNQFIVTIRKNNDKYIINGKSYNVDEKIFINKYRITTGSFLFEKPSLNQIISSSNNQTLNVKFFESLPITGNIKNLSFTNYDSSVNYLLYSGFKGSISKFNISSNVTDLSNNKILLELDLPNITDTTIILKLYKIVNNELVNDNNYPVDVNYDTVINKWVTILPTLSEFVILDPTSPTTIVGGDPFIKSIKTNNIYMLPNTWNKVVLYQSSKYQVIGYNEKLPASTLLTMKKYIYNREIELTNSMLIGYQFNYLLKLEVIDLENNNKLILDTFNGNIIKNNNIIIENIVTKNGLNCLEKNFYYPKKNIKAYNINLDNGNIITIKIDNYWIDLNNIKLYISNNENISNITGELIEHDDINNISLQ
jgi:uncharacterized protein YjbI with pentapeptide repeats